MIARRSFSAAPVALPSITLEYPQSDFLPVCGVGLPLAVHRHGLMVSIRFEELPRFAWSLVTMGNVTKRPVNLAIAIKFSVFCITHLANPEMRAIASAWIPLAILFVYESHEAPSLCPVNDPRVCV